MKIDDFDIGKEFFYLSGFKWRCTDKGTRTITAIKLDDDKKDYWFNGPPYSVSEIVFDEFKMKNCFYNLNEEILDRIDESKSSSHPNFKGEDVIKLMESNDKYPNKSLLRFNKVSVDGRILHPYSAEKIKDVWHIKVFELFSREYSHITEDEFVQLKIANEDDMIKRKIEANN